MSQTIAKASEYDRFGPWIDEVDEPDDVPRLFRSHPLDFGSLPLVLKVPRNIARRDATPDMDLYDRLVILGRESLTVLSRRVAKRDRRAVAFEAPGYDIVEIRLADVVAINEYVNLLDGQLTVSTSTGESVTVPFNGSARGSITRLVDALRLAAGAGPASSVGGAIRAAGLSLAVPGALPNPGREDTHLVTRFLELRDRNPDLACWATHGGVSLRPLPDGARGVARRLAHVVSPMTMHGATVMADSVAFELLGRHARLVRGRGSVYSSARLVIPFGAPDLLELAPHPIYEGATAVTIGAGAWRADIAVPTGSASERLWRTAAGR